MQDKHETYMRMAIEEAKKGLEDGNLAVGSIIVRDGDIVARGRNFVNTTNDPTAHAETVALRNAGADLNESSNSEYILYTTFEPCPMCAGAIMNTNISTVVMGGRPGVDTRWGNYTIEALIEMANYSDKLNVVTGILPQECVNIRGT